MFEEQREIIVLRVTVKDILQRLTALKNIDCNEFIDTVKEQFDGYDFEDIEEVVGFDNWIDISKDGEYELAVKIDHEDAYEFTLYICVENKKVTVNNVL